MSEFFEDCRQDGVPAIFIYAGVAGEYDPKTGVVSKEEDPLDTYVLPTSYSAGNDASFEDRMSVMTDARRVYLPTDDLKREPKPGDAIEFDGARWSVKGVSKVMEGEVIAFFIMVVRK